MIAIRQAAQAVGGFAAGVVVGADAGDGGVEAHAFGADQRQGFEEVERAFPAVHAAVVEQPRRRVQRGGVRVFTRVVETPVEETVRLREEHATIERHAVDRPATQAEVNAFLATLTLPETKGSVLR